MVTTVRFFPALSVVMALLVAVLPVAVSVGGGAPVLVLTFAVRRGHPHPHWRQMSNRLEGTV